MTYLASKDEKILICTLETLQAILVDSSENTRIFEQSGGIDLVCTLLRHMKGSENIMYIDLIRHKCIELFSVYLQSEDAYPDQEKAKPVPEKKSLLSNVLGEAFIEKLERLIDFGHVQ